ncbi:hypothetical protein O181_035556 [Austropuccinia psidii MF-1]|uniref:Uncharacterized protein n=1 Tax=Austropuccinia psidii MF-1 TaxID=1389203 RepID=A0A9Q3D2U8_9BASI|nr:hypothetical protein [Austropuccinia psidii MF-1]
MSFPHNNSYHPPAEGSSLHLAEFEQMKNTISQRDEVIARLMQQAEDEAAAQNNPSALESNKKKDKGKGRRKGFQNQLPVAQSSNIGSSRKPTG